MSTSNVRSPIAATTTTSDSNGPNSNIGRESPSTAATALPIESNQISPDDVVAAIATIGARGIPYVIIIVVWSSFIAFGTLFYNYYDGYGWNKGLYYAVNVGFNIGWNWTDVEETDSEVFSVFFLLLGVFLLALFIVYIGEVAVDRRNKWLVDYIETRNTAAERELGLAAPESWQDWLYRLYSQNFITVNFMIALISWVSVGVIWSCIYIEWNFIDGLYFSLSSLSAGGMYSIPSDSPDWYYAFVGIYAAIGIPIMALAFGLFAGTIILQHVYYYQFAFLSYPVTKEEIQALKEIEDDGEDDDDNNTNGNNNNNNNNYNNNDRSMKGKRRRRRDSKFVFNKFSFLVLIAIRIKLVDRALIKCFLKKFKEIGGNNVDAAYAAADAEDEVVEEEVGTLMQGVQSYQGVSYQQNQYY